MTVGTNAKFLVLLAAMFLASAFAPVGGGHRAQAEEPAERAEERAERRAEKAEERAEERREKAEERREEAEETTGGQAEGTREQAEGSESNSRGPQKVTLRIKGDPKTEFSGTCTVGDEKYALSGQVPQSYHYKLGGQQLECEIRKQNASGGSLKVILTGNGIHAVQQIGSAGTLSLAYDGNSISSSVSSSSSSEEASSDSSSSQVISSSWTSSDS
ncbi:MAG: hypothetical protein M3N45_05990 [Actinomycetota bacterium]|nr:hypothetical protein [Actinomycetota bacterium]